MVLTSKWSEFTSKTPKLTSKCPEFTSKTPKLTSETPKLTCKDTVLMVYKLGEQYINTVRLIYFQSASIVSFLKNAK
ncbi:hypothetical protein SRABI133_01692 [Peribacillus simplex]|uniref:Uncharacterized protein n=1 Tax=Peribacillus simplex TaxID=1478 RepID=A0A9W4KU35_9BACI|nr:hypothetical protein SRABI133_01692 [Peribacillus simplex]